MRSQGLLQFIDTVQEDPILRDRLSELRTLEELVRLARQSGHVLQERDLQLWAHHPAFDASWWPWAGAGRQVRHAFFRGEPLSAPRRQLAAPARAA